MDTYAAGRSVSEIEEAAYRRFARIGERRDQVAGTLSGGEQQMLTLSRALSRDPVMILLDELSMGLAPLIVEELFTVVHELAATGVTIVVVEQFASIVVDVADQVAVVAQGRIRLQGPPDEIRDSLHAAYLGGGD